MSALSELEATQSAGKECSQKAFWKRYWWTHNRMTGKIARVKRVVDMKTHNQASEDLKYWLSKTPQERIAAVTFLVRQMLEPGQRMDRSMFIRRKLKE